MVNLGLLLDRFCDFGVGGLLGSLFGFVRAPVGLLTPLVSPLVEQTREVKKLDL